MANTTAPARRIFTGSTCDHGIHGGCTMCTKHADQCDYGDCSGRAVQVVTMRTGERRRCCPRCVRVLRLTGMVRRTP